MTNFRRAYLIKNANGLAISAPSSSDSTEFDPLLIRTGEQYEQMVEYIQRLNWRRDPEGTLKFIRFAADFASSHCHTGRFADGALENILHEIGRNLDALLIKKHANYHVISVPNIRRYSSRNVVHVITFALPAGGPTRTIKNWIDLDSDSCSSVVLVDQRHYDVPQWLEKVVTRSGGDLIRIPPELPLLARAKWLREIGHSSDMVVLHTYTFDVVPGVAFAVAGGPPVALVNHSDHIFWLNGSVSDMVIHQRDVSSEISAERRFVRSEVVLPIPLSEPDSALTKAEARRRLGIPESQIVLLSVGSVWKLFPTKVHNFPATALRILEQNSHAHLYLLAWDWGYRPDFLYGCRHERFHFFPEQLDASLYQAAADVYLEGFPFGSQTAMLEAALCGLPIVRAYAPKDRLLVADDVAISGVIDSPATEEEYIQHVNRFIHDFDVRRRVGTELRNRVRCSHLGQTWRSQLEDVYQRLQRLSHSSRPVAKTRCMVTETDRAIFAWQQAKVMYEQATRPAGSASDSMLVQRLWDEVYRLRRSGHYMVAFSMLRCLCAVEGWKRNHLAAMLKLVPHKLLYGGKRGASRPYA